MFVWLTSLFVYQTHNGSEGPRNSAVKVTNLNTRKFLLLIKPTTFNLSAQWIKLKPFWPFSGLIGKPFMQKTICTIIGSKWEENLEQKENLLTVWDLQCKTIECL